MKLFRNIAALLFLALSFAIAGPSFAAGRGHEVTVDYGMTLQEMIAKGKYDDVNSYLVQSNFPIEKASGLSTVKVELISLDSGESLVSSIAAANLLHEKGYRAATVTELLALGAQYPGLLAGKTLVAAGTVYSIPNTAHKAVAVIRGYVTLSGKVVRVAEVCGAGVTCFQEDKNVLFAAVKK